MEVVLLYQVRPRLPLNPGLRWVNLVDRVHEANVAIKSPYWRYSIGYHSVLFPITQSVSTFCTLQ